MSSEQHDKEASGSVLLVDGTIFAVQADPNLASSGFSISLLEKSSAIGGIRAQLVDTLPTNEYAVSIIRLTWSRSVESTIPVCQLVKKRNTQPVESGISKRGYRRRIATLI